MEIDWRKQAKEFLRLHGWVLEPYCASHPAFPLGEDLSVYGGPEGFCEQSYPKAWNIYKAFIEGAVVIMEDLEKKRIKELEDKKNSM